MTEETRLERARRTLEAFRRQAHSVPAAAAAEEEGAPDGRKILSRSFDAAKSDDEPEKNPDLERALRVRDHLRNTQGRDFSKSYDRDRDM